MIAGRMLGINPFDQPDVESAKIAARGLLDARPEPHRAAFTVEGVEVRVSDPELAASGTVAGVLDALWARLPEDGYVSIQAYVNRLELPPAPRACASSSPPIPVARPRSAGDPGSCTRPASTTRAAPRTACSCRSSSAPTSTSRSPVARSPSASSSQAQAAGDASVLADGHGRPVVTLTLTDPQLEVLSLFEAAQ